MGNNALFSILFDCFRDKGETGQFPYFFPKHFILPPAQVFERLKYGEVATSSSAASRPQRHVIKGVNVCRAAWKSIFGIGAGSCEPTCFSVLFLFLYHTFYVTLEMPRDNVFLTVVGAKVARKLSLCSNQNSGWQWRVWSSSGYEIYPADFEQRTCSDLWMHFFFGRNLSVNCRNIAGDQGLLHLH